MSRDLRLLAFSLFLWGVGEGLFIYLQPIYLTELGADPLQVGFVLSLVGAAMTVTHIPADPGTGSGGRR
jgi:predicted MFS family arabinose efflux permease